MKVVLIGGSGTVGSHILEALLNCKSQFDITILTRPDSTAQFPICSDTQKVTLVRKDHTLTNFKSVFQDQDAVICATSIQSVSQQKIMLEAAEAVGIKRFILNEYGNSPYNQIGLPDLDRFRQPKRENLAFAQKLAAQNSNFTWSALATGNFIDYSLKKFPAFGFEIEQRKARLVDDGTEPYTAVTLEDIGTAVAGILLHLEQTANKYLHIRSVYTSQRGILGAFEEATNEKWHVEHVDSKYLLDTGRKSLAQGERQGMMDLLVAQLFEKGAGRSVVVSQDQSDNDLLGVREKPVLEIIQKVLREVATDN